MNGSAAAISRLLQSGEPAILCEIIETRGSTPRETGSLMLVSVHACAGTIGGGHLEFAAIDHARRMLSAVTERDETETVLGPETGQCCGGRVRLAFRLVDEAVRRDLAERLAALEDRRKDVVLFGAGHVGRALVRALEPLPFRVSVVETRPEALDVLAGSVRTVASPMPEAEIPSIRPGGAVVILTHDHALDFLIAAEALKRGDLGYVGMIGSKTKRAVFASYLASEGLDPRLIDRLVLPIGSRDLIDKRPEVIAALTAAELLKALA